MSHRWFSRPGVSTLLLVVLALAPAPFVAAQPVAVPADERGLPTLAPILEPVTKGVVNIAVQGRIPVEQNPLYQDPFFRRYFGLPDRPLEREFQSAGSGVVVDAEQGYVVTNNHVVQHADRIIVGLYDGRRLKAKLVGADPEADVALLQIPADDLVAVPMGDSEALKIGDFVVAIGNPFGLGQTVTSGIVSALERSGLGIEGYENFVQTDAAINPGNSGGALIDLGGRLVGINTAIVGPAGGNVGIGFAIPADMVRDIVDQLVRYGEVRRGHLGVAVQDLSPEIASALAAEGRRGAMVVEVVRGSAAEKAGLKRGDIVLTVNGRPVAGAAQLRNRIGLVRLGQKVNLGIFRNGKVLAITAYVGPKSA